MSEFVTREEVERLLAEQERRITAQVRELMGAGKKQEEPPPLPDQSSRVPRWLTTILVGLAILSVFFFCTWRGLFIYFDFDDVMNLHFAWTPPLQDLIVANLTPFSTLYRPVGSAYYRTSFALFGWNPAAFRLVTYAFLIANLLLVYQIGRRLTNSTEAGVLAALLSSFHPRFRQIYLSNGTVYDVLCGTFSLLTLLYYLHLRGREASRLKIHQWIGLLALFVMALNAKEMAVFLPPLFLIYELIYRWNSPRDGRSIIQWFLKYADVAVVTGLVALGAAWVRMRAGSAFHGNPAYAPEFSVARFSQNMRALYSDAFYFERSVSTLEVFLVWAGLFIIASLLRRKDLTFVAWFIILAPLPAVFFPKRGFFVMYIAMFGFAIYAASLLVVVRDWFVRKLWWRRVLPGAWQLDRVGLFVITAALVIGGLSDRTSPMVVTDQAQTMISETKRDILRLNAPIPKGGQILMLNCRFPPDAYGPLMMMQLLYRDRDLQVDRPAMMPKRPVGAELAKYDLIVDHDGEKFVVVSQKNGSEQPRQLPRLR